MSENTAEKSYELVTDALVQSALVNDKGEDAELLSFEVKSFTNEGDNYTSVVAEVLVKYSLDGSEFDVSYVAKLNPLRPLSSFTEVIEEMFGRETDILSTIIEGMNKELEMLELPSLKTPKVYSKCLEQSKESFLAENLRVQGYIMYDRRKGMDLDHCTLVLNNLGRFHASSLLYEETLSPKTIPESFDYFKEVYNEVDHPAYATFNTMVISQVENTCDFLKKAGPKYEACEKWLSDHSQEVTKIIMDGFLPNNSLDVFVHGETWANNLLFKYNEDNIPIDIGMVDFQISKKASPVTDLNYFFYSSIDGDLRSTEMDTMIGIYYDAFQEVFEKSGKDVPFSIEELREEVNNRKLFGWCCAILLTPVTLAESDELFDVDKYNEDELDECVKLTKEKYEKMSGRDAFKERLLAVFDEMIDSNLLDSD